MADDLTPLYVRLPRREADLLGQTAFEMGTSKRALVTEAVRAHLDLERGRIELPAGGQPPEVLTLAQAADLLQVPNDAVRELAEAGDLPARCIAGEWRFARAALLDWLARPDRPAGPGVNGGA